MFAYLYICTVPVCMMPTKSRRSCQFPSNWSYRWFWVTMCVLRSKPTSSVRVVCSPKSWAISLTPIVFIYQLLIWRISPILLQYPRPKEVSFWFFVGIWTIQIEVTSHLKFLPDGLGHKLVSMVVCKSEVKKKHFQIMLFSSWLNYYLGVNFSSRFNLLHVLLGH